MNMYVYCHQQSKGNVTHSYIDSFPPPPSPLSPPLPSQVIHRRLRLSLERAPASTELLDCSAKTLRIEPLVSVEGLEKFLNGIVAKQWCDYDRGSFHFVRVARETVTPITFHRASDFDQNGILYWIGTNARYRHMYMYIHAYIV